MAMRSAVDPRLLKCARATRPFIVTSVALGALTATLVIAQAWLLAKVIVGAFAGGQRVAELRTPLAVLLIVVVVRAAVAWGREVLAQRCSARAKAQLRAALLRHVGALGPQRLGEQRVGGLAVLATTGIDALDGYFSLYLPQLVLSVIVPLAVAVVLIGVDWVSALIIAVTLPLIPLFMALVGATTRDRTGAQLRILQQLGGHFLDVVAGLPTLKVFGRAKLQIDTIAQVSDQYRRTALSALRVTFLSSLVLELVATISVALVAVGVGLRLMAGDVELRTALTVLILAPEAYLPLRLLGANYHASAEGMSAAERVFAVLEAPLPARGTRTEVPDLSTSRISAENLRVVYHGRAQPALDDVSLSVRPGELLAITGPSGCGKSTMLAALLGFLAPRTGSVRIGEVDLSVLDPEAWRVHVSWMPQHPHLFATSIAENIRLARPDATRAELRRAAVNAGLEDVVAARSEGLDAMLGERGAGLSLGERQRVALARAFLRDSPLLLLDEPTAHLDGATEDELVAALGRLVRGRTVILVAHRPALVQLADHVLELGRLPVAA